jgi:hypothetical protein
MPVRFVRPFACLFDEDLGIGSTRRSDRVHLQAVAASAHRRDHIARSQVQHEPRLVVREHPEHLAAAVPLFHSEVSERPYPPDARSRPSTEHAAKVRSAATRYRGSDAARQP